MLKNIRASKSVYMLAYVLELVFYCIRGHYIYVETGFFGLSGNTITYVFHVAGSLLIMLCWSPRFKPLILLSSGLFAAGFIPALFLPEGVLRLIFACAGMFGLGGAVSACRCGYAFVSNNSERLTGMSLMIILVALIHRTDWAGTENAFTNQVLPIIVIALLIFCLLRFKEEDFDVREETGPEDKKGLYWAFAFFTAYFAIDGFIYDLANTSIETKPTFMFAGLIIAGIMLFIMLGKLMYAPQGLPAVYFSVLASSVIIVAARSGLLPPCVVPPLGLCLHIPEFLTDALFFRRFLLGLFLALDLPLPCGQVAVVLLHNLCGLVIHPHERLRIRVSILFEDAWDLVLSPFNLTLHALDLCRQGFAFLALEQPGRFRKLLFQLRQIHVFHVPDRSRLVLHLDH